jgi:hypothetical protein
MRVRRPNRLKGVFRVVQKRYAELHRQEDALPLLLYLVRGLSGWKSPRHGRTLTAYGIGVVIVLAILNGIVWRAGTQRLRELNVFSAGFILGMLGTYIAAWLYGYRRIA